MLQLLPVAAQPLRLQGVFRRQVQSGRHAVILVVPLAVRRQH